ncbi:NAD(P)/FAD-dependent oxidoreductase [Humibacter albus]|uniref:NAD(P)/FAD-dependent oxidoreductase n=1 Tax=Humibacter albus TaxID=427754 RepID=UPI0003B4AF53|nr:FAD/NAD(P)-binding oxidoreductase [Humibacter albus]
MRHVVVIGAGPAGLAAARAARMRGARVTLLDSSDRLGGQYWRHLPDARPAENEGALHHEWSAFQRLRAGLLEDGDCRILMNAHVWSLESRHDAAGIVNVVLGPPDGVGRERIALTPDAVVLATGAHDRMLPFPGWDLPGVVTGGAAQAFAKGERLAIGRRVVVAGAGPFLLPVASSLARTNAKVVGVFEANRLRRVAAGWLPRPWQLLRTPAKIAELAGYVGGQVRFGIPYRTGRAVVSAHGIDRVEAVTVAVVDPEWRPIAGTEKRIAVDAVCISHGFTPRLELAVAAGCRLISAPSGERFVEVDSDQHTSVRGVYAAGELTGIGGADLALVEGGIAGAAAAGGGMSASERRTASRKRAVYAGFAQRIDAAHSIRPGWTSWLDDDTIICRCESVRFGALREARAATGSRSLRSLKLTTRAGLGMCQGRVCGRTVEQLLSTDDTAVTDRRPIAMPIRLGELATNAGSARSHDPNECLPQGSGREEP